MADTTLTNEQQVKCFIQTATDEQIKCLIRTATDELNERALKAKKEEVKWYGIWLLYCLGSARNAKFPLDEARFKQVWDLFDELLPKERGGTCWGLFAQCIEKHLNQVAITSS